MNFTQLLLDAKENPASALEILRMYRPLLIKESVRDNVLDEDLLQELSIVLLRCITTFSI